jgi:serine/threonine-protein kinase
MRFTITVTGGPHTGEQFTFSAGGPYLVGRGSAAVSLPRDPTCSARHLRIDADPPHFRLTDLGSRNGTRVNDRLVRTTDVHPGDRVRLGATQLRIDLLDLPAAAEPGLPDIPGFVVEGKLGSTLTGIVYRARWGNDGTLVAVKRPEGVSRALHARLRREAGLLEAVRHPHVVRFHSSGTAGDRFVYATEYVPAADLYSWVQREGPRPLAEAIAVVRQVLAALGCLHAQAIVHRNLMPGNVWLSGEPGRWHARLTDFSLARFAGPEAEAPPWLDGGAMTLTGERAGLPPFVPPEQATDLHSVTAAGDQYAAAAVLYFLLTGHAPYDPSPPGQDPFEMVRSCDPVPLRTRRSDLPVALGTVMFQALQRQPGDRFASVAALDDALAPFAA